MTTEYIEDTNNEFGVSHSWKDVTICDSIVTKRGTTVEIINRPKWGLACYMDNSIQSALKDEYLYHEALVHPVMSSICDPQRVMIIGGGEGATAREVLKWKSVQVVDMYEWDSDIVKLFSTKYRQWGKDSWDDSRLSIYNYDIFEEIKNVPSIKYDIIIIDLFEPCDENYNKWKELIKELPKWITLNGSIVMYSGMRNITSHIQPYEKLLELIEFNEIKEGHLVENKNMNRIITPYKVYIPSFSGESMFILLTSNSSNNINFDMLSKLSIDTCMTNDIWKSYRIFNW